MAHIMPTEPTPGTGATGTLTTLICQPDGSHVSGDTMMPNQARSSASWTERLRDIPSDAVALRRRLLPAPPPWRHIAGLDKEVVS